MYKRGDAEEAGEDGVFASNALGAEAKSANLLERRIDTAFCVDSALLHNGGLVGGVEAFEPSPFRQPSSGILSRASLPTPPPIYNFNFANASANALLTGSSFCFFK